MTLSITEVAASTGLRPSALRYYEELGLIAPAARSGGRRCYEPDVLPRLSFVALCQESGFTLEEIRRLLGARPGDRRGWREVAERKLREIDRTMSRLRAMRAHLQLALACDCDRIEACELARDAAVRRRANR